MHQEKSIIKVPCTGNRSMQLTSSTVDTFHGHAKTKSTETSVFPPNASSLWWRRSGHCSLKISELFSKSAAVFYVALSPDRLNWRNSRGQLSKVIFNFGKRVVIIYKAWTRQTVTSTNPICNVCVCTRMDGNVRSRRRTVLDLVLLCEHTPKFIKLQVQALSTKNLIVWKFRYKVWNGYT